MYLVTGLLAYMDFAPIHSQWWHNGKWPDWALGSFNKWSPVREWTGRILCPPCAAMAENGYFVIMDLWAGTKEQAAILPVHYSGNPIAPDGFRYWWGQGAGREWRPVSMLSWYLFHGWWTIVWWLLYASDIFYWRRWWALGLFRLPLVPN